MSLNVLLGQNPKQTPVSAWKCNLLQFIDCRRAKDTEVFAAAPPDYRPAHFLNEEH